MADPNALINVTSPKDLLSKLKIDAGISFPGEDLVVAFFEYATEVRKDMDPELRKKWDEIILQKYIEANNFMIDAFNLPWKKF